MFDKWLVNIVFSEWWAGASKLAGPTLRVLVLAFEFFAEIVEASPRLFESVVKIVLHHIHYKLLPKL